MKNIIRSIRAWANDYEPVKARSLALAVLAVVGAFGYTEVASDLEPIALAGVGLVNAIVVYFVGKSARSKVTSQHTLDGDPEAAAEASESFDDEPVEYEPVELLTDAEADEADGIDGDADDGIRV